jgi:hypothetical protein
LFFLFFIQRETDTNRRSKIEKDMITENGTRHAVERLNYFAHKKYTVRPPKNANSMDAWN